jgi:hypothetical protein
MLDKSDAAEATNSGTATTNDIATSSTSSAHHCTG